MIRLITSNCKSREIARLFGEQVIERSILEKNKILFIISYSISNEKLLKALKVKYEIVE